MKRSCKGLDITSVEVVTPWVYDCISRHKKRADFRELILTIGEIPEEEYIKAIRERDEAPILKAAENIAKHCTEHIKARKLDLKPVFYREIIDPSSGKTRLIGRASPLQQCYDYIVHHGSAEIWRRRNVYQQASSIKGRGQTYGVWLIERLAEKDKRAARWAKKHKVKYVGKHKIHSKTDIRKCFPSAKVNVFMRLYRRDCANEDLIWLYETLLTTHQVDGYEGFMIGSIISQDAMQYMLSFAYRYVMDLHKARRNKKIKMVSSMILFMDDILLTGSSRKNLKKAIDLMVIYCRENLELEIKPTWQIVKWDETPVDMMGYKVYANSGTVLRARVFIRLRRQALRFIRTGRIVLPQAKRICSYLGYIRQRKKRIKLNLATRKIKKRLQIEKLERTAKKIVSMAERRQNHDSRIFGKTRSPAVHAAA